MPLYLGDVRPEPVVLRHVLPEDGRSHLGVGAVGVVSDLLARRGEGAIECQGAVRRRAGDGACHGVFRDVTHGLSAGKGTVMTHWNNQEQKRKSHWSKMLFWSTFSVMGMTSHLCFKIERKKPRNKMYLKQ